MRTVWIATVTALVACTPAARAQDNEARAIVEKAIQAQGGLDNLTKANAGYRKIKGVYQSPFFPFAGESYSEPGNRVRFTLHGTGDDKAVLGMVIDGGDGWDSYYESIRPFDAKRKEQMARSSHVDKVCGLVALVRDKGYTLTLV